MNYTFFIARRYFRRGRLGYLFLTNLFAIISVAVGVASLVLVLGVMTGFDRDLKKKIIGILPPVTVEVLGGIPDWSEIEDKVASCPEVVSWAPFSETQAILRSERFLTTVIIRAIDFEKEDAVTGFRRYLVESSASTGKQGLILGSELARNIKVKTGDRLAIITGSGTAPSFFPVTGIFHTGLYHFDASMAFIPLSGSYSLFPFGNRPQALGVKVNDIYAADKSARRIASVVGPSYIVESWIDKNRALFSALALERRAMAAILTLIILVAGFNIATSLMMTVWRKSKEIGVLRALGVSRGGIRAIFLWMGFLTGLWGVVSGLAVGLSLAYVGDHYQLVKLPGAVYDLYYLPIKVPAGDVLWICLSAFLIALLASFFPAQEAARVAPAVTLRSE
ncbi:MAG: ABC transporter permease [Candidatus Omnitrophota bacterium]